MHPVNCDGWQAVIEALRIIALEHCDGGTLLDNGSNMSRDWVTYRYHCAYKNSHLCKWRLRVRIARYFGGEMDLSVNAFPRETRADHHSVHTALIEINGMARHVKHSGIQARGPHLMFKHLAMETPSLLRLSRKEITNFLVTRSIEDPFNTQPECLKKWCERTLQDEARKNSGVVKGPGQARAGTAGGLWGYSHVFEFESVSAKPDFSADSPYLVPGCMIITEHPGAPSCSLFTTLNFSLNLVRARQWYGHRHIAGAVDHTFKVNSVLSSSLEI